MLFRGKIVAEFNVFRVRKWWIMKHILRIFRSYWLAAMLLVLFVYGAVLANLWLPDKMADIVNNGIVKEDVAAIWSNGWQMIAVTAAGGVASVVAAFLAVKIATGLARQLREEVFVRIESFAPADFNTSIIDRKSVV